ncbi:MAG: beta-carotene 15,15'-monooxygenase, partial [Prevotella nigrescens]|nr:beta-carotene 15,15'-monooxygenase [Prevotella nigrescens]
QSESQVVTLAKTKVKRYYHRPLRIRRYVLYLPKNKTYLNYATLSSYDGELGKHFLLYTHKGLFGWYVADDLREIE